MYGSRLADMWAGVNQAEVKATWAETLEQFTLDELRYALDACMKSYDFPPSLPQFLALCKAQKKPENLKLDAPRVPMPDHVRKQLAEFKRKHVVGMKAENVVRLKGDAA